MNLRVFGRRDRSLQIRRQKYHAYVAVFSCQNLELSEYLKNQTFFVIVNSYKKKKISNCIHIYSHCRRIS